MSTNCSPANGVGTVWNGLAKWAINDLLPETRTSLGILTIT